LDAGWLVVLGLVNQGRNRVVLHVVGSVGSEHFLGFEKWEKSGIILSGDSEAMGIGAMTDKLWEEFYTSMVKMGVFRQGCPIRRLAAWRL